MKTTRILLLSATFLLFPWCAAQLFSQQEGTKKIVITKRTVDADGSESSETIVKKGAAAENFDVEKYLEENRADNTRIEVKIKGGDEDRSIVVKGSKTIRISGDEEEIWNVGSGDWNMGDWDARKWNWNQGNCTVNVREKDACLGVYTDAVAEGNVEGARINGFTEESAAQEGNMEDGDVITAVNGKSVKSHDDLWNEIAQYKVADKVKVDSLREGKAMTTEATLKACRDNSSRVQILDQEGQQVRNFLSWNWSDDDQRQLRERSIITIRRGEGDAPKVNAMPNGQPEAQGRSLQLTGFRAYPNPTQGQITVAFTAEPVATTVTFFDLSGRQLFREELNAFDGRYNQQFDLSEYAKGTIIVHVQQGDKVYTEQVIVN